MSLKSQDIVIALKVFTFRNTKWNQRELALSLGMSLAEVNGGLKRCIKAGLMIAGGSRNEAPQSIPFSLQEYITSGVRYSFYVEKGAMTRGIPTGLVGAKLEGKLSIGEPSDIQVWPTPQGKARGVGIKPLFKSVPKIIERVENKELYILLSLVDLIRVGRVRERNMASETILKILNSGTNLV